MSEIHTEKRPFASKFLCRSEQKVPFCPEIRYFIAESHKCQTLYANCEGFYRRRLESSQDKKLLENFVFNFMYYYEYSEWESKSKNDRVLHVEQICNRIIFLSRKYDLNEEIHFSVVWVYYFDYGLKKTQATPVFKIFKQKSGNEAVFLDVFLKTYENWDCYLENAEFTNSFLCIPQHGEYCFDDETNTLILEYVRSVKLKTNENDCSFGALPKMPFSQVAVRPLFTEAMSFMSKKLEQMTLYFRALCSYWDDFSGSLWNVAIYILLVFKKVKEFSLTCLRTIHNEAFMLLNAVTETGDSSNLFKFEYWSKHAVPVISESLICSDEQKLIMKILDEGALLIGFLKSPQKDWPIILQSFCCLFRSSRLVLNKIVALFPSCLIIKKLIVLLNIVVNISEGAVWINSLKFTKIKSLTSKINTDRDENRNLGTDSSVLSTAYSSSSAVFENQYKLPGTPHTKTQNDFNKFNHLSYENILPNLFSLEMTSANENYNRLFKKYSAKFFQDLPTCSEAPSFTEIGILVEKLDEYKIFLFRKASIPHLTWCINQFIKADFRFKPRGIFSLEVINRFEKTLGYLFFPLEFCAVGLFLLETIGEEGEKYNQSEWTF